MSNLFFRRPRLLALTLVLVLVSGLSALAVLPRSEDPELVARNATIFSFWPGADAARVESLVLDPIEDALAQFEEIKETFGSARPGIATVSIELHDSIVDVDEVWSRVRDELGDLAPGLPEGARAPEFVDAEITAWTLIVALTAEDGLEDTEGILTRLAEDVADRLRALPGTQDTEIHGEVQEEVVVTVDPALLAAHGLDVAGLARRVAAADSKVSAGELRGSTEMQLEVRGELDSLDRIESLPVVEGADGRFLRLCDLGEVRKGWLTPPASEAWIGGRRGVTVAARMESGRRVDLWARSARAAVEDLWTELPRGVRIQTLFDQSSYTEQRLGTLVENFAMGCGLVMLVILVTMGWRSALLVGLSLPLTSLMVLQGLRMAGIPLHQMSITGLILALGLLIDNAIVMVDEVNKRHAREPDMGRAISAAVRALAVPLLGSTVTTALAFAPIALMPGGAGEFVGSIAVSVILAVASSLFLSLTVLPALQGFLQGRFERRGKHTTRRWWSSGLHLPRIVPLYRAALTGAFRRPWIGLALGLLLPVLGFLQAGKLQEQFFPPADRDQFQVELELPQSTPLERTREVAQAAREVLLAHPRVEAVHWFLGESGPKFYYNHLEDQRDSPHYGSAMVQLDGPRGTGRVMRELQAELDRALPAARMLVRQIEQGPPFLAPVELRLFGPDLARLRGLGEELRTELSRLPGITHTRTSLDPGHPKLMLRLDEEEARLAGLDNTEVAGRLAAGLDGVRGGSLLEATEELPVRVRVLEEQRSDLSRVASLELAGERGWTPLDALGELELVPELGTIPHKDGQRVNTIQGFVSAGTLPSEVLAALLERLEQRGFQPPSGYRLALGGEAAKRDEAVGNLASTAGVLLVLMLAALVLSFDSFRMALVIGSVGVLSVGLSLGSIWLWGHPFGFMGIVGTMGLIGVAINDSIVVLASIREHEDARAGDPEAVAGVVLDSSRHVFSTSLTTMAGFTPLLLEGGGFWPPVAVAIGGGVAGATILAITWVPALYRLVLCRRPRAARAVLAPAHA